MATKFIVPLQKLIRDFNLEVVYLPEDAAGISISTPEVNRPGLQLSGFFDYFDHQRMQILGKSEFAFLDQFDEEERTRRVDDYFASQPSAVVITRNIEVTDRMRSAAQKYKVPLLRTADGTSAFMAGLIGELNVELAPRVTRHGVLVEVYGEGILLLGESGVGKSETAIELVKRGHRLIADDAVEIRRISRETLIGTAPALIRYYMELRGIGVINARHIFGVGAVKPESNVDLVVNFELWDDDKAYDRLGLETEYTSILGVNVPSVTIPVRPGRNLAVILELAAMNNRQKKMGYNAAVALAQEHDKLVDNGWRY